MTTAQEFECPLAQPMLHHRRSTKTPMEAPNPGWYFEIKEQTPLRSKDSSCTPQDTENDSPSQPPQKDK